MNVSENEALDNAIAALGQGQKGTARQFLRSAIEKEIAKLREEFKDLHFRMINILTEKQLDAKFKDGKTIREKSLDYRKILGLKI